MDNLDKWLASATDGASWRAIAERLSTTHPTIQRRLRQNTASAIIELADAYNVNPIDGLLAAGVLAEHHLDEKLKTLNLDAYSDLELAQAVVDRLEEEGSESPIATVTEFPTVENTPDVQPEPYAANRRRPEPEEGDDDFGPGA